MNYQILTDIIKKQIIRSFAMLDAWFDKDLIIRYHKPPSLPGNVISRLTDVIHTNDFLLREINKAVGNPSRTVNDQVADYAPELASVTEAVENFSMLSNRVAQHEYTELPAIREQLRDQLYDCLLLLELPTNDSGLLCQTSFTVNNRETFKVYQVVYFMAMLIQKEVNALEQMAGSMEAKTTMQHDEATGACCSPTSRK